MTSSIHHSTRKLLRRASLLLTCWALSACAVAGEPHEEAPVETAELALTQQDSVFGFENVADWTASDGILESSTHHTEGAAALGLRDFSYAELTSSALSTLSGVTDELALDIRVPVSSVWGQVHMYVSSPTLGLNRAWVGLASLENVPSNTWSTLSFAVPAHLESAFQQQVSDLRFTLALNVPYSSTATVLDNLRFEGGTPTPACGDGSPYTLDVTTVPDFDDVILEDMICTFYTVYPQLAQRFNPAAATTVGLHITDQPGIAWASGTNTFYNRQFMLDNPLGADVVVHETMHVVQLGYWGEVPGWIIEGGADYVRDAYGLKNEEAGWSIPSGWTYGSHYLFGYGDAAAFFKWMDATHRVGLPPVVDALDDILRQGAYSSETWVDLTGYDLETLWQQYSNYNAPPPATSGITVYEHDGFGGRAVVLDRGQYDVLDMRARAIANDWISSIQVPPGYTVTAYYDAGYTGTSVQYTSDAPTLGAMNDKISAIVVE
ncbi:basic secretory protein-like protein [Sorangium sp. So ce367]|uniref:basic secretory protein-like protein n=1 Tax=Sorangium sp. So ce367 TaxID=3133305 RepID=UPI003F641A81